MVDRTDHASLNEVKTEFINKYGYLFTFSNTTWFSHLYLNPAWRVNVMLCVLHEANTDFSG
jgi:hypothetical protein